MDAQDRARRYRALDEPAAPAVDEFTRQLSALGDSAAVGAIRGCAMYFHTLGNQTMSGYDVSDLLTSVAARMERDDL